MTKKGSKVVQSNTDSTVKKIPGGVTGKGFKPGQSGNPGGRPKRKLLTDVTDELLEEKLSNPVTREQYKEALWRDLMSGKVVASMTRSEVWERTEGKVTQPVEIDGNLKVTLSQAIQKARQRVKK